MSSTADEIIEQVRELKALARAARETNRLSFEANGWFWPYP